MLSQWSDSFQKERLFRRYAALPPEHGAWVLLFSPMLAGLWLGGSFHAGSLLLVLAALAAFLVKQPVTMMVKVASGRRPRSDLAPALFWAVVYSLFGLASVLGLLWRGYGFVLWLAVPAVPVLGWHLWLVSRRAERRQAVVEITGSSMLALAAPAAFWTGTGQYDPFGWLLWGLMVLQTAGSILYAYLRLEQRPMKEVPALTERLKMGRTALSVTSINVLVVGGLAAQGVLPVLLPLAYAVQWLEAIWGTLRPAVGFKPVSIGMRQLAVTSLFTIVFILAWI